MNDQEFGSFVKATFTALETKQNALEEKFNIGSFKRYEVNVDKETITFSADDNKTLSAKYIPIATFSPEKNSWMWAWNNTAYSKASIKKAEKLKSLSELTGYEIFNTPAVGIDENMAWEMVAMSVYMLEAQGVYRAPANNLWYFYALEDVGE